MKLGQYQVYCGSEEKRELLKEKINLAVGLTKSKDKYSVIIKALDFLNESMIRQKAGQMTRPL